MDHTEIVTQMKKLNGLMQDYLDRMDMDAVDEKDSQDCKKAPKKGKED